jgi:arginyl-tRNA synthetase
VHVGYGTMNGADGKPFKTRSGDTVKLDEVLAMVTEAAAGKMQKPDAAAAAKVGIAALKFADLCNNVRKDYIFDIEKFTSFEGRTGPYLLYTVARINSIFKKAGVTPGGITAVQVNGATRGIAAAVIKLADAYSEAAENYTLNGIADAAHNAAAKFNILYGQENIQNNPGNLAAAALVRTALLFALNTLGIEPVDEM